MELNNNAIIDRLYLVWMGFSRLFLELPKNIFKDSAALAHVSLLVDISTNFWGIWLSKAIYNMTTFNHNI